MLLIQRGALVSGLLLVVGCGSVASNGAPDALTGAAPIVTITSPTAQQSLAGPTVTVSGTITTPLTVSAVTATDAAIDAGTVTFTQTTFSIDVTLQPGSNAISVKVVDQLGQAGTAAVTVRDTNLFDFAPATLVIGHPDFTTATGALTASGLQNPYGRVSWSAGILWLPDYAHNRVLGVHGFPSTNGAPADLVLGQANLTTGTSGVSATAMNNPQSTQVAGGKLFVDEFGNNRVTIWSSTPTASSAPLSVAVGQANLTSNALTCTAGGLSGPEDFRVVGDRLIVSDAGHNRVLIWNSIPTSSGVAADIVLGQADFTHCTANDDNQDGVAETTPTARTLTYPAGVWSDGTRLIIADLSNRRVLIWNTFPTASFTPANLVLGQTNLVSNTNPTTASATVLANPYFLDSDGTRLAVGDGSFNRVMIWNAIPSANTTPADIVLGQRDFTHATDNDDNQDGNADATPSARTFSAVGGVTFVRDTLFIADNNNARYLVFGALPCPTGSHETPADSGTCVANP